MFVIRIFGILMWRTLFGIFCITLIVGASSCKKDDLITDSSAKLEFSTDTVMFDTVFTTIGSATKRLKIFNPHKKDIKVSNIYFKNGSRTNFRMNVDGLSSSHIKDIEIPGEDSIFVFIEVTVDPNGGNNPLVIEDAIIFETNGNLQDVDLVAWGQDAYFYATILFGDARNYILPNDKPTVFYGYAVIDSASSLTIPAGTQIYFHESSGILVLNEGTLKVMGEKDNQVVMQGDRLEQDFRAEPGQWDQIYLSPGSIDNEIHYAVIKNGIIGVQADTIGSSTPTLVMSNTTIENMTAFGLLSRGSNIVVTNSVIANCGRQTVALVWGGDATFEHCTMANYWRFGSRDEGQVLLNNYFLGPGDVPFPRPLNVSFDNCILYGNREDELELDDNDGSDFNFIFRNCLLRSELNTTDALNYVDIIKNPLDVTVEGSAHDPVFNDPTEGDYNLFEQSVARDKAAVSSILEDIDGNMRDADPDLGAYEWFPE